MTTDGTQLRATLRTWASGVTVVTAFGQDRHCGMTVSSFSSVSLDPALVMVCLNKDTKTAAAVLAHQAFAISILAADQIALSARFAGQEPAYKSENERFQGIDYEVLPSGSLVLTGAVAYLDCRVWQIYDGGTHYIVVGEVIETAADESREPLVYMNRAYHQLTKAD